MVGEGREEGVWWVRREGVWVRGERRECGG